MQAPMSLALNGNALTVSNTLAETLAVDNIASASAQQLGQQLATLIQQRQQNEQEKLVFAVVFPFSIHNLLMRAWLADAGIDPDKDIELLVLPPSQMVDHLKLQHIDGFFAGAPWNSVAIQQGVGQCLMPATKLWQQAPDKVLGVTQEWAQQHPNTLQALIHAISQGAQWCHEHPEKAAELLAEALEQPTEALLPALTGEFRYKLGDSPVSIHNMLVLDPLQAGEAKVEHGEWFLQQMQRWGWIQADTNIKHVAQECFSSH